MNNFKRNNIIAGWAVFAISAIVYLLTMEPTTSLWDCAEFIATSYKLEVGHPPGAPLFMMIARLFTAIAPGTQHIAVMVNIMSSLSSAFTILFLFWSITHLARKIYNKKHDELTSAQSWTVIGAGLVGALAYAFTDTFWFSAVEGEVYAMSSMFTAMVFWAILKWENVADEPHSNRWLVLIAYLMGLSIGIHILNLLTIPALVLVYYFKKYPEVTKWGLTKALLVMGAILLSIMAIIIPNTIAVGAWFDKMFVNGFGLPINSGLLFFVVLIFALCAVGIYFTHKKGKVVANTIILCTSVIFIGYGSYASLIIRASANPPMNSNNPNNPYAMLSFLNREQYGNRPLIKGPCYSSQPESYQYKTTYYVGDDGKYKASTQVSGLNYPDELTFLFPRMYRESAQSDYEAWGRVVGRTIPYNGEMVTVPTFGENLRFFFSYQLNFMYWRYFLWNFVGRQSDIQSTGEITDGNWLSGIKFIDEIYLGPQDNIPSEMAANKGRNTYFFLPFIFGLIGLIYQLNRDKRNFSVVMMLFLMMGIALVIYFNTTPGEPRERDYVYAGSFYAFSIWIGFAVMWLADLLAKLTKKNTVATAAIATVMCSCVPVILIAQNWDDHDRSGRYFARDVGYNYLESTLPNSIIMNYGDNDTFPLWYNQEVEEVRMDVRIMNMSYLGADWYIDEMRLKSNDSDPVPFSLPRSKYVNTNDLIPVENIVTTPADIKEVMKFLASEDPKSKLPLQDGNSIDYIPAKVMAIKVNKENALASGIVKAEDAHLMVDTVFVALDKKRVDKSQLMILDLLANFDWKRPLYFTQIHSLYDFGLTDYLQFDGFAYRLVPIKTSSENVRKTGRIDVDYLYDNLMNKFKYGNINDPKVYVDSFISHINSSAQTRNAFARLAVGLTERGDSIKAIEVLDAGIEKLPFSQVRHSRMQTPPVIEAYYRAGAFDKGNEILEDYTKNLQEYIEYYMRFRDDKADMVSYKLKEKIVGLMEINEIANNYGQKEQVEEIGKFFKQVGLAE